MIRARWIAIGLVVTVGVGALIGPRGSWPADQAAFAGDQKVADLAALAAATGGPRRATAIEDLRRIGSADSFDALEALAASKDDQLAALALSAIARSEDSGAKESLESVLEDTTRTSAARSFALVAWCKMRSDSGASWDDVKSYVDEQCGDDATLEDAATAVKAQYSAKGGR